MPKPGPRKVEKAKDFKGAMTRLIKELKQFKLLITITLVLAAISSILAIFTPNILSDLTDKISEGLIVDKANLNKVITKTSESLDQEKLSILIPQILDIQLDKNTINNILTSNEITEEEKQIFNDFLKDKENMMTNLTALPKNILNKILKDSSYNDINITINDKITLLEFLNNKENKQIPTSIANIIFTEFEIEGTKISPIDQANFISVFSTINENTNQTTIYQKFDELPKSINSVIEPFMDITSIKKISIFLVCIYLISAIFNYIGSISMTNVTNNFARKLRSNISSKINKLPLNYFDKNQAGDILSRITNDVDTLAMSMDQSLSTLVSATTLFIGTIIMMFVTNWIMAITAILSSLIGFLFMFLVLGKSQKYFDLRQKELGNLNAHIEEIYSSLNVVKAYNGKKISDEKFDNLNKKLYNANRKSRFLSGLMHPMMHFIGNFGYVAVCIVGALLTMNGNISFGVIVAFITYVRLFTSPLSQIAQAMSSLQSAAATSERVYEFIDEKEQSNQDNIQKSLSKQKVKGNIEFKNVIFKYDGNDSPTIKNFSAKVKSGQKIAIVGPTGAGKTTMVNLLMKFYEITDGDILIDGISINDLTRENIHELFTMVLQDTWLFNGTVRENIIYNRKNISNKKIEEVCKTIGLDHFIKTLPQGYDTILSDNESVSSGQRQLLTIARGMIEDAPFLILDEATSNVDTRTEELVQKAMDKLTEGKTSFIIAHRLSTIKNADLILVMKDGNIIEQGNHKKLMEQNGFYAELYNSQFEL